jgi:hypothetical protein
MLPARRMPEEEVCPVRDELLGELYHADENCVSDLVATVAPDIRALLALYCYHRSHLHTRGLAIAGSCDQDDLSAIRRPRRRVSLRKVQRSFVASHRRVSLHHPPSRHAGNWSPSQDVAN